MTSIDETKTVTKKVKVGTKCDICGRESRDPNEYGDWHYADTRHGDWGNDSHESAEYYDVCSPACYLKLMRLAVLDLGGSRTGELDDVPIAFVKGIVDALPEEPRALAEHLRGEAEALIDGLKGKPDELWDDGAMKALKGVAEAMGVDFTAQWASYVQKREAVRRDVE